VGDTESSHAGDLHLPPGRVVEIPGRGALFLREVSGPRGAPVLLLAHGLAMTADLNWAMSLAALGRHFRVVAPDLRGHGRGIPIPSGDWFSIEECADDLAALADVLGVDRCIAVGYSMGGLVTQALWRRHRDLVEGLVLCATGTGPGTPLERLGLMGIAPLVSAARLLPPALRPRAEVVGEVLFGPAQRDGIGRWAWRELRRTGLDAVGLAAYAIGAFESAGWVGQIDVPAEVVVTRRDRVVPPTRQQQLAAAIPGAAVRLLDAGHGACLNEPELFSGVLLEACRSVAARIAMPAGRA
jgi:pimeloyl-ACP methyl ester carboxylesterase